MDLWNRGDWLVDDVRGRLRDVAEFPVLHRREPDRLQWFPVATVRRTDSCGRGNPHHRPGGANGLVLTAGILGLIISVLCIVMIYTLRLQSLTPGAGLWMFAVFSLIAAVAGGVGQSQMDYTAEG
jgi:hypothetical protein